MATKQLTAKVAEAARFDPAKVPPKNRANPKLWPPQYVWQKGDRGTHWGLRLYKDGRKTVVVRHWNSLGQRQQIATLGEYRSFPDFAAAKSAALVAMAEMARSNGLPATRDPNEAGTVAGIVQWYIETHIDAKRSPRYRKDCEYSLKTYIKPRIGTKMPAEFEGDRGPQLAEDFHRAVTVGKRTEAADADQAAPGAAGEAPKRRKKGGGPVVANAAVRLLRAAFNEAIRVRKLPANFANPWATVRLNAEKPRTAVMTAEQAAMLMERIDAHPDSRFRNFFRLQLFTGMRGGELARAKWEHVRLEGDNPAITLPASKNGRPYVAPLNPDAVAELEAMRDAAASKRGWVFPGRSKRPDRKDSHMAVPAKDFRDLVKAAGLKGVSPHVIRATVLTQLAAKGATAEQLQKLSNHRSLSTLAKYVRLGEDVAQKLAVDLGSIYRDARLIAKAKAAKKAEQGDNVIDFPVASARE